MSKQSKFAGGGKIGKTAYANQVSAQYSNLTPSRANSSTSNNKTIANQQVGGSSSHNDISRFTSGINSRGGGYNTPSGTQALYQQSNTETKSKPQNPSGASKVNQRVPNKKAAAPDRYNPRTPNVIKKGGSGKFLNKSTPLQKLGSNMKKK